MKKKISILLILLLILSFIKYKYTSNKCKNITYATENNLTTGFFNEYKLYGINTLNIVFSDGSTAVVKINGIEKKPPHKRVEYSVFLKKNKNKIWKVKNVTDTTNTKK